MSWAKPWTFKSPFPQSRKDLKLCEMKFRDSVNGAGDTGNSEGSFFSPLVIIWTELKGGAESKKENEIC